MNYVPQAADRFFSARLDHRNTRVLGEDLSSKAPAARGQGQCGHTESITTFASTSRPANTSPTLLLQSLADEACIAIVKRCET